MTQKILDQRTLQKLLRYDQSTGLFHWISKRGGARASLLAGTINGNGYVEIKINGTQYKAHILAWLYMHGEFPDMEIDHENHVRSDNRMQNLVKAGHLKNAKNQALRKDNVTGCCGVYWCKGRRKWTVKIRVDGKLKSIGRFAKFDDAVSARKLAAERFGFHPNHGAVLEHVQSRLEEKRPSKRLVNVDGIEMNLSEASEFLGYSKSTVMKRLSRSESIERALDHRGNWASSDDKGSRARAALFGLSEG